MYVVSTFYKFFPFPNYFEFRREIKNTLLAGGLLGNVLIADEGINATVAGERAGMDSLYAYFKSHPDIGEVQVKESLSEIQPFKRAKVRLKKELISLGAPASPMQGVGAYVSAKEWNALIENPETIVLDTRNIYELEHGTFERAIDPKIQDFKQLPKFIEEQLGDKKDAPIATFCTGGIRCEKLTAFMREQGYSNVYHLQGGILQYLKDIPKSESKWQGKCFVFDGREAVGHEIGESKSDGSET